MTAFVFTETVPTDACVSAALGASAGAPFVTADLGKAVKLGTAQNYVLCTGGNEIDGFVQAVEPFTVNAGFSFGSVMLEGRKQAVVGANQGGVAMAIGDLVVADTQTALGTAGAPAVKTGTPAHAFWRCIRIVSGAGAAGSVVLVERV